VADTETLGIVVVLAEKLLAYWGAASGLHQLVARVVGEGDILLGLETIAFDDGVAV